MPTRHLELGLTMESASYLKSLSLGRILAVQVTVGLA